MIYFFTILLTIFFIVIFTFFSPYLKLIDEPNQRKLHSKATPVIGGISIYLSIVALIPFLNIDGFITIILFSSAIILILGVLDDALELGVITRLISQLIAGLIIIGSGLSIQDLGDYYIFNPINLGLFGVLLTIVAVIGLTNAINFIDGIDGLCGGLVLVALITLLIFINFSESKIDTIIINIISLCIFIFLLVNLGFSPLKKIFLGDAGSMVLGFILSWLLIYYSHPSIDSIHPVLVLWCVTIPIYDLIGVVIRRLIYKINPFKPDRRHIHHILIDLGLDPTKVFFIIIFFSVILNSIGGIVYFTFGPAPALLCYFILLSIYVYISYFLSNKLNR